MTRSSGGFTGGFLIEAERAFLAGCFGCLGVGGAALLFLFMTLGVFQAQFLALVRTIAIPPLPFVVSVQPAVTPVVSAVSRVTAIEVFITADNQPGSARITQVKLPVTQTLAVCVRGAAGATERFTVRVTMPDGRVVTAFASDLVTDPTGKAVCLGPLVEMPTTPGVMRIDALVGTSVAGSTAVTVLQ